MNSALRDWMSSLTPLLCKPPCDVLADQLRRIVGAEGEYVGHLAALGVDDADAVAGRHAHGVALTGRDADGLWHAASLCLAVRPARRDQPQQESQPAAQALRRFAPRCDAVRSQAASLAVKNRVRPNFSPEKDSPSRLAFRPPGERAFESPLRAPPPGFDLLGCPGRRSGQATGRRHPVQPRISRSLRTLTQSFVC